MTSNKHPNQRCRSERLSRTTACATVLLLLFGDVVATASTQATNEVGLSYKILSTRPTVTIQVSLKPRHGFEAVDVEAGSGVESMTPCSFSSVLAGRSYVCTVIVTGKPTDAAMTLNVVARHATSGGPVPELEIHHFSIKNDVFVPPKTDKAVARPTLTSTPTRSEK